MRWLYFLAICLSASIATAASPLSNKEVVLMLRSGYSSKSVQAELQARRVREAFDPAIKKSMLEFGDSAQLIAALESGIYVVTSSEADLAKAREVAIAARRQAQIEEDQKSNTLYQAKLAETRAQAAAAAAAPAGGTLILDALKPRLVRCRDGAVSRARRDRAGDEENCRTLFFRALVRALPQIHAPAG